MGIFGLKVGWCSGAAGWCRNFPSLRVWLLGDIEVVKGLESGAPNGISFRHRNPVVLLGLSPSVHPASQRRAQEPYSAFVGPSGLGAPTWC
jgi:hypothetical protein